MKKRWLAGLMTHQYKKLQVTMKCGCSLTLCPGHAFWCTSFTPTRDLPTWPRWLNSLQHLRRGLASVRQPPPVLDASAENQVRWASLQSCRPCCLEQSPRLHSVGQTQKFSRNFSKLTVLPVYIVILTHLFILLFVATWNVRRSIL